MALRRDRARSTRCNSRCRAKAPTVPRGMISYSKRTQIALVIVSLSFPDDALACVLCVDLGMAYSLGAGDGEASDQTFANFKSGFR